MESIMDISKDYFIEMTPAELLKEVHKEGEATGWDGEQVREKMLDLFQRSKYYCTALALLLSLGELHGWKGNAVKLSVDSAMSTLAMP